MTIIESKYKDSADLLNSKIDLKIANIVQMKSELEDMKKKITSSSTVSERLYVFSDISFFYVKMEIFLSFVVKDFIKRNDTNDANDANDANNIMNTNAK